MADEKIQLESLFSLIYGMYIVSTAYEGKLNGQIANAVMQITAEPICIAAAMHKDNLTTTLVEKSGIMGISVLEEDVPMTFIGNFGFKSGRSIDKFCDCEYITGELGTPLVIDHCLAVVEAKVINIMEVYTHKLVVGEVVMARALKEGGTPLTYSNYHLIKRGKSPKNAPTVVFNAL